MEIDDPDLSDLFAQLGLDNSESAIDEFIAEHAPLPTHIPLHKASFWEPAQAEFIEKAIAEDAVWAIVVEHLDARFREHF